jgi:hypothetical protein
MRCTTIQEGRVVEPAWGGAPDFDLVLSASQLALLGQRRGQRSTLFYLRVPERPAFLSCAAFPG